MESLTVPKIYGLDEMDRENLVSSLREHGAAGNIDNAPWADFPYKPVASFRIATSPKYLYIKFDVEGKGLKAEYEKINDPVWQDSCVEFFIEDKDGKGYRNFEINCIATLLVAHQESKGKDIVHITEHEAEGIIRFSSLERRVFTEKDGDFRWYVVVGIPWKLLGYDEIPHSVRANFYKCADGSRWPHYLCWSPVGTPEPDFHRPEYFGTLNFE